MNLGIAILLVFYLVVAQSTSTVLGLPVGYQLPLVFCSSIAFPICFSGFWLKYHASKSSPSRLDPEWICYSIWTIGLLVPLAFGWSEFVLETLNLRGWVLVDEFILVLPAMVSFLWIQVQLDRFHFRNEQSQPTLWSLLTRCQFEFGAAAFPAVTLFAIRDVANAAMISQWQVALLIGISFALLIVLFPILFSYLGGVSKFEDARQVAWLKTVCQDAGLSHLQLCKWNSEIVNAVILGILPIGRKLIVSQGMLDSFDESQLRAVIRHEVAHVRFRHLIWRLAILALPIVMLFMVCGVNRVLPTELFQRFSVNEYQLAITTTVLYCGYVYVAMGIMARLMEHEADLFADANSQIHVKSIGGLEASSMREVLKKFAKEYPQTAAQKSWLHPSLLDRMVLLRRASIQPEVSRQLKNQIRTTKFVVFAFNLAIGIGLLLVTRTS